MSIDVKECLKKMTLEEKILLLEGADKGFTNSVKRLEIPRILLTDGPHGVRVEKGTDPKGDAPYLMTREMEKTTAFPCEAAMAATWDEELVGRIGQSMGEECRNYGVGVLLGPGVNGKRSPLGGRNFEYFSEDPYLSGKMAATMIRGIQSEGVGACLKHYALNDQESRRNSVNVHADERTKWEIYLKPFEIAIKEADPWSIMASYNKIDGEYVAENKEFLTHILREKLGFKGVVVSDWGAVHDKEKSVKAGLNLQMPGPGGKDAVIKAVQEGRITEEEIDQRVTEILELIRKVSEPEKRTGIEKESKEESKINWEKHHELAVQTSAESMVLLKNEGNILPLKQQKKVAVIGSLAKYPYIVGGGSSSLTPRKTDDPLEFLEQNCQVVYAEGYSGNDSAKELLEQVKHVATEADVALIFVGVSTSESLDREQLLLPEEQIQVVQEAAKVNPNIILVTQCGSAIDYSDIEKEVKAILHVWIPGEGFGAAFADIIFGRKSPCGKLAETFPYCLENTPAYQDFPGIRDDVYYREGILTGYRYYDTKKILPRYPFGYGLSYTQFKFSNLNLSTHEMKNGEKLTVTVDVENTGKMKGAEVVQLYVRDVKSALFRPEKELKAFTRVELEAGETKTVEMNLEEEAFSYYVPHLGRFAVESGDFELLIGNSSKDILLMDMVEFISKDEVRMPLGMTDSFKDFFKDNRYTKYAQQFLESLGVDETHMFYQMIMGVNLIQIQELMEILGVERKKREQMVECLIRRKDIWK